MLKKMMIMLGMMTGEKQSGRPAKGKLIEKKQAVTAMDLKRERMKQKKQKLTKLKVKENTQ